MRESADFSDRQELFKRVAAHAQVREGPQAVERLLRALFRAHSQTPPGAELPTERTLARMARMPLPVVVALLSELEKTGMVKRDAHMRVALTPEAATAMAGSWGWKVGPSAGKGSKTTSGPPALICAQCAGTGITLSGPQWERLLTTLRRHLTSSSAHSVEALLRAVGYMHLREALAGRHVLVIGEDVSMAAAVALAGKVLSQGGRLARRVVALHPDDRRLAALRDIAVAEGVLVGLVTRDLRHPLPEDLRGEFDTLFIDAPEDLSRLILYISRAIDAARAEGAYVFLNLAHRPAGEQMEVQQAIAGMGLVVEQVVPGFNRLPGVQVRARDLYVLAVTDETQPLREGEYTGEGLGVGVPARGVVQTYVCTTCHTQVAVGGEGGGRFPDLKTLKREGCPTCRDHSFTLLSEREVGGNGSGNGSAD